MKPVYTKLSNERRKEFAVYTQILEDDSGRKSVRKYPDTPEAMPHIRRIAEGSEKLRRQYLGTEIGINAWELQEDCIAFEFLPGKTYADEVQETFERDGADAAIEMIRRYLEMVMPENLLVPFHFVPEFAKLFGNRVHEPFWRKTLPVTNIDCNMDNMIRTETGFQMIDCEWVTEIPVPVEYLIWRVLHYFLEGNPAREELERHGIFRACGLNTRDAKLYLEMEDRFQEWIEGDVIPRHKLTSAAEAAEKTDVPEALSDQTGSGKAASRQAIPMKTASGQAEAAQIPGVQADSGRTPRSGRLGATAEKAFRHGKYLLSHGYSGYRHMLQERAWRPFEEGAYDSWCRNSRPGASRSEDYRNSRPGASRPEDYQNSRSGASRLEDYRNSRPGASQPEGHQKKEEPENIRFYVVIERGGAGRKAQRDTVRSVREQSWKNWKTGLPAPEDPDDGSAWIVHLRAGWILTPDAFRRMASAIRDVQADLLYADEDHITPDGKTLFSPVLKPDFSIDYLASRDYIGPFFAVRRSVFEAAGGLDAQFGAAQSYDLLWRVIEQTGSVHHIPAVLCHIQQHPGITSSELARQARCFREGLPALNAHYRRGGIPAEAVADSAFPVYRTRYHWDSEPLVSIIVPNKDHAEDLRKCITSVEERSTYRKFEWIIVENNSTEPETFAYYEQLKQQAHVTVVTWAGAFNYAKINNYGATFARGDYLLLLNNDTELISPEGLGELVRTAQRPDVGIAGARLLYPDRRLQHGGIVLGIGGIAGHVFTDLEEQDPGYGMRAVCTMNYSAVTGACLMVRKDLYEAAGGMEESLAVAFNDVDFCLKIRERGLRVVYNPQALFFHNESRTRGQENTQEKVDRFYTEIIWFIERWRDVLCAGDPYYNPAFAVDPPGFMRLDYQD